MKMCEIIVVVSLLLCISGCKSVPTVSPVTKLNNVVIVSTGPVNIGTTTAITNIDQRKPAKTVKEKKKVVDTETVVTTSSGTTTTHIVVTEITPVKDRTWMLILLPFLYLAWKFRSKLKI